MVYYRNYEFVDTYYTQMTDCHSFFNEIINPQVADLYVSW